MAMIWGPLVRIHSSNGMRPLKTTENENQRDALLGMNSAFWPDKSLFHAGGSPSEGVVLTLGVSGVDRGRCIALPLSFR